LCAVVSGFAIASQVLAAVIGIAGVGGCGALRDGSQQADRPKLARVSLFAYPWVWTDERGERVKFSRWRGEPLVVTAMFTSCRATCPRTIGKLRKVDDELRRQGRASQFLLVTLDPSTDTPERLREFKQSENLPDSWRFLSGDASETKELADALDIHVLDMGAHLIHDGRIVVFDAQGMPSRSFSGFGLDEEAPAF
jgi:protein SCO1/2